MMSRWKRTLMYHDAIGALNHNFDRDELICGVNHRMPELLAAVSLVQWAGLDGLLTDMRPANR
ncbi:MAG: hypothetical protein R2932_43500 [Caldilineaceae bacterium]